MSFFFVAVALFVLVKAVNRILPKPVVIVESPAVVIAAKPVVAPKARARKSAK